MNLNKTIATLVVRLVLGFIFLMQGYGKIFEFGLEKVHSKFFVSRYEGILPDFVTYSTAYYTSYVELIGGFLLILGLKRNYALYALGSVLVIVTFGHGLVEPIWDLSHVMYRTILLVTLLILPEKWDRFSLDYILRKK